MPENHGVMRADLVIRWRAKLGATSATAVMVSSVRMATNGSLSARRRTCAACRSQRTACAGRTSWVILVTRLKLAL